METDIQFITSYQKIWIILHYIPKLIRGSNFHHIPVLNKLTCLSIHDERTKLNGVKNLLACVTSLVEKCLANSIWMVTQHSMNAAYGWLTLSLTENTRSKTLIFNCLLTVNNSDLADIANMITKFPIIQCKLQCLNMDQCEQNNVNLPSATTFFQNGTLKA